MADTFAGHSQTKHSPADYVFLVTPDDDDDLANTTRAISFAVAGDLKVTTAGGTTVTIPSGALAAGVVHPLRVVRVFATGTDADGIVGYY